MCFSQINHRHMSQEWESHVVSYNNSWCNRFLYLRAKLKWTINPGWPSSPGPLLSVHWWRVCEVNMDPTPPPHVSPPLRRHCDGNLRTCTFIFHLNAPRMKSSSTQRRREPNPGSRAGVLRRRLAAAAALTWDLWVAEGSLIYISFLSCLGSESNAQRSLTWWTELLWLGWEKL